MNFRRNRPRHVGHAARERSSDWRYPQIEKGNSERSVISTKRRIQNAIASIKEWKKEHEVS